MTILSNRTRAGQSSRTGSPPWATLLDLDQTLVLTDAIEVLRKARRWPEVYVAFGQTVLPPGTRGFLDELRQTGLVGVVTTSPRPYAERLLLHHRIELPVLVAYHDVARRKPHPAPILRALEIVDVPANRAVHVGDRAEDEVAATAAGVSSVLVSWTTEMRPPGAAASWDEVLRRVKFAQQEGR
jgi:phosphoglycolate phosphatase-like HAD superfamily hydrolase